MANIALLGNGFDLHHGLPTTYNDMMHLMEFLASPHFFVQEHTSYHILNSYLKDYSFDNFRDDYERIYDFVQANKESLRKNKIDVSELHQLRQALQNSFWFQYFQSNIRINLGWIDFESEIKKVIDIFATIIKNSFLEHDTIFHDSGQKVYFQFANSQIYDKNKRYQDRLRNFSVKAENGQIQVVLDEKYKTNSNVISHCNIDLGLLVNDLYADLGIIKKAICFYISNFIDCVCDSIKPSTALKRVLEYDCVITLNYSDTYEIVYQRGGMEEKRHSAEVFHYHGCLTDRDIVVGVNDSTEDNEMKNGQFDTTFLCFKKYCQRFISDELSEYDRLIDEYLKEVNLYLQEESSSDMVNSLDVIGHSLDVSDADLIRRLFAMCDVITIYYHNEKAKMNYKHNLIKIFGKTFVDRMALEKRILLKKLDDYSPMK